MTPAVAVCTRPPIAGQRAAPPEAPKEDDPMTPRHKTDVEALQERLRLVGRASELEAERLKLLQRIAGEEITMLSGETCPSAEDHREKLEAVTEDLRDVEEAIASIDRERFL